MIKAYHFKLLILTSLFLWSSCKKKDKWKQPTSVKFKMDINRTPGLGGNLSFTGGNIKLAYFTFNGNREQGGDIYFNKTYNPLLVIFDPNNVVPEWNFEIPQGSYSQIKISFKTFDEGDQNIIVTGSYKNSTNNVTYPIRFEFSVDEAYEVVSKTSSGSTNIILDKNVASTAEITMDPVYWFQTVTTAMLDTAQVAAVGGAQTILINDTINSNIYEEVKDRVHDDVSRVIFN